LPTDLVFLTGATGFVGHHVLGELRAAGYRVRALVRDRSAAVDCELVHGDLRRPGELARAIDGCRYIVHCAALYSFSPAHRHDIALINVQGTAGLLEAARVAGVERAIVTSSSAALGAARNGRPATEIDWAPAGAPSVYHDSKVEQERVAFASRVPVVTLLPTTPIGPGDAKPTPTGRLIVDFARGRIFAKPPRTGGLNLVAVEDVARAHVAALTRARSGERYIVGAENVTLEDLWKMLAALTGRRAPRLRVPNGVIFGIAWLDEVRCRIQANATPVVPLEGVRMSQHRMYADCAKATRELDCHPGPVREALERAVAWYRAHDYFN